ncbi:MAG: cysteine desulfurase [Hyphomicrobiaceae bacterium]|nr:cysteine desulfurase [Hyphomicrobiaceae bacterium]
MPTLEPAAIDRALDDLVAAARGFLSPATPSASPGTHTAAAVGAFPPEREGDLASSPPAPQATADREDALAFDQRLSRLVADLSARPPLDATDLLCTVSAAVPSLPGAHAHRSVVSPQPALPELPFARELAALIAPLRLPATPRTTSSEHGRHDKVFDEHEFGAFEAKRTARPFDVDAIRADFPILSRTVHGRPLIWFDNAATTQKPRAVIERLAHFYETENSNIHRAAHALAARATDAYETARATVARFLGAGSDTEIVFTRGSTEAINLVAATHGMQHVGIGDEIVLTHLEHHANIVPWQELARVKGAHVRIAPVDDSGALLLDDLGRLLNSRTKIVAVSQVSNALGTITPIAAIIEMAHRVGARVLVDGAQSVSHMPVDVTHLDADFFVFSGHKLFGPTGIGVLYAKAELLDAMPPYQTGGNMIRDVTFTRSLFQGAPQRFEAGTGNIADAVGLGAAIEYVESIGLPAIARYEHGLLEYATARLGEIAGLTIIGQAPEKASLISFVLRGVDSEAVGRTLDAHGIAVRSGHHCAQPILRRFGLEATVRPSFAFYNTCSEIDVMVDALAALQLDRHVSRM